MAYLRRPAMATDTATSKFAQFLSSSKVDARRIMAASHSLESLQREDRHIRLVKGRAKQEGASEADKAEKRKPRSGRPVTERAMAAALKGGALSGPTKNRILKAVNHILEQKKQEKVELKALF